MKVGVIGTGFGRYAIEPVYKNHGFDVEVVSPRDGAGVDRMLASKPDLVSVHSPPFMHLEHVTKSIDHGVPVLCDKPFGLSGAQAREMRDRAKAKGVLNFLNLEMRHKPSFVKLVEIARSGRIGAPVHLHWCFFANGFRGRPYVWMSDKDVGGGWINAFGSHLIDLNRWVFDSEITKCGGVMRTEVKKRPDSEGKERTVTSEDGYSGWFLMKNGGTANHDTSNATAVSLPTRAIVTCENGAVELLNDTKIIVRKAVEMKGLTNEERIRLSQKVAEGDESYDIPRATGETHEPALTPWLKLVKEAVQAKKQITPSFDDGVAVGEALDMLRANMTHI